jgi:hypothetical protein
MPRHGRRPAGRAGRALAPPRPQVPQGPPRRSHPLRRVLLALLVACAVTAIIVADRHTLAESLRVLGTADRVWLLLALGAEAISLTAFGLSRRRLLRANGYPARLGPVMAVTYAANALSISVPFAGAELAVVYSYPRVPQTRSRRRHHELDARGVRDLLDVGARVPAGGRGAGRRGAGGGGLRVRGRRPVPGARGGGAARAALRPGPRRACTACSPG